MTKEINTKVLVLGGGPGGYVAAIRCGQLGLDTVLVDKDRLGGTCLIRGCIPSKAVIHAASEFDAMKRASDEPRFGISLKSAPKIDVAAMTAWKEGVVDKLNGGVGFLLKRAKVKVLSGHGRFSDAKTCHVATEDGEILVRAEHVILAAGSVPVELPNLPFGGSVLSSTDALSLDKLPACLAVVGGGYIGLELGSAFAKLGSSVTVVEALDAILPQYDRQLVEPVERWLKERGVEVLTSTKALASEKGGLRVQLPDGEERLVKAEKVLVTVGRKPATEGWGLEEMAIAMDGRFVKVDESCAASTTNVWAIGDLVGEPMLAHKASAQGEMVAEIIAGKRRRFDPRAIPAVCFTEPEIVSVGVGPDAPDTIVGLFPFAANGRSLSMDGGEGFVRVVARKDNHRILGVQAVGGHISELSGAFAQAIEMGAVLEDVAGVIHAHPTLSEGFHEACLKALGHAIHI